MMKKGMVFFLLLSLALFPRMVRGEETLAFEETRIQARALGQETAWVLDAEGTVWAWDYGAAPPRALCTLPRLPQQLINGECSLEELAADQQAQAAGTVQQFAVGTDGLYALNQYTGRLGRVDGAGLHWTDFSFDPRLLLSPEGWPRQIFAFLADPEGAWVLAEYPEEAEERWYFSRVLRLEWETGAVTCWDAPDACGLCRYGEDWLLLCSDGTESHLAVLNPRTGAISPLPLSLPAGDAGGLNYHVETDAIYLAAHLGVYRQAAGGPFEMIAANPFSYGGPTLQGQCLNDGRYALAGMGVAVLPGQKAENARVLVLAADSLDAAWHREFCLSHPDVLADVRARTLSAPEIAQAIRSGDRETDLFQVRVDAAFGRLMEKGYAANLSENPRLAQSAAALYPAIARAVTDDSGALRAWPLSLDLTGLWECKTELWEKHFGQEPLPTTWKGLFQAMLRFEESGQAEGDLFLMEWDYQPLLEMILRDYVVQREAAGDAVDFTDPVLRETLEALAQVQACMQARGISYLFEGDVYWDSEIIGVHSLFAYGAGQSSHKAMLGPSDALPPFAFSEGESPVIRGALTVLLLNPRAPHPELAQAYLAAWAQQRSNPVCAALLRTDAAVPLENPAWDGKNPARQWKVSPEGIAQWQETAPRLRFLERGVLTGDAMNQQISVLCTRCSQGQMTLDELLNQLNAVSRLIRLEQE